MQHVSSFIWKRTGTVCAACVAACVSMGAGCPVLYTPGEEVLLASSPILAEVLADGELSCEEHLSRNQFNQCPTERPETGADSGGVTWSRDWFLGIFPNPLHAPLECLRGLSEQLGPSSFQCCYDGEQLVDQGDLAGSFDFVSPGVSLILHYLYDVAPLDQCQSE